MFIKREATVLTFLILFDHSPLLFLQILLNVT